MNSRQRALSLRAASECENALHPTCKCRCGGALHGAARVKDPRQLPLTDPHSPSTECPACRGKGSRVWYDYNGAPQESECWKCKGVGRIIKRSVEKAELPVGVETPQGSPGK